MVFFYLNLCLLTLESVTFSFFGAGYFHVNIFIKLLVVRFVGNSLSLSGLAFVFDWPGAVLILKANSLTTEPRPS